MLPTKIRESRFLEFDPSAKLIRRQLTLSIKMKVIIVGAGIAGLSAAIGLRREGHDIQVCLNHVQPFGYSELQC